MSQREALSAVLTRHRELADQGMAPVERLRRDGSSGAALAAPHRTFVAGQGDWAVSPEFPVPNRGGRRRVRAIRSRAGYELATGALARVHTIRDVGGRQ